MNSESQIRVLIAEDEDHIRSVLEQFLAGRGYAVTAYKSGKLALDALQAGSFHVAIIDLVMSEMDGLEVLRHLRSDRDAPEVLMITSSNTIDTAISAIKLGAYDYLPKPLRMAEVDVMVRRAWERRELIRANALLRHRTSLVSSITSNHADMVATVDQASALASSDDVIVLHGEVGVGKTHMARFIHNRSGRASDVYAEVNSRIGIGDIFQHLCGTDTIPSRGRYRVPVSGLFQVAENGTIAIDTDLFTESEAAKLVEVLRERAYSRDGAAHERFPLRARIILCSDDRNSWVNEVPGVHLTIPPLRERPHDIADIARDILHNSPEIPATVITDDAVSFFETYGWPGNIRELKAVLTRVSLLSRNSELSIPDIKMVLIWESMSSETGGAALESVEKLYIETVLQRSSWHQGRAADTLGISTKTLYRKMREYGFIRPKKRKLARPVRAE